MPDALGTLCLCSAIFAQQGLPQADPRPASHSPPSQDSDMLGRPYTKENGLLGAVGVAETGAPLANLPTPVAWLAACEDVDGLAADPGSAKRAAILSAFEVFRTSVLERRRSTWQARFEEVNAMVNGDLENPMDDDQIRRVVYAFTRGCVRESIATFDAERTALQRALEEAVAPAVAEHAIAAAAQRLWRTRAASYLRDTEPVPVPPCVSADLRAELAGVAARPEARDALTARLAEHDAEFDAALRGMLDSIATAFSLPEDPVRVLRPVASLAERMADIDDRTIAAIVPLVDDPGAAWRRRLLASRCPHAAPVIDAWLALNELAGSLPDPAFSTRVREAIDALHTQFDAMRMPHRLGWRAQIVLGAMPGHPDHEAYRTTMRSLASTAQLIAVALIADLDRSENEPKATFEESLAMRAREPTAPLTGALPRGELTPAAISEDWPPPVIERKRVALLTAERGTDAIGAGNR